MSWRDDLQRGSVNGIDVVFASDEAAYGRRVQLHEYPLRDKPFPEDLGRKARQYSVECFLIGADFNVRRDQLIDELEKPGPINLIHPHYGALRVSLVEPGRIRHSSREGGMCTVSLRFVEDGERELPAVATDTVQRLTQVADAGIADIIDSFETITTEGYPGFVGDSLLGSLNDGLDFLRDVNGKINAAIAPISTIASTIDAIGNNLVTLINTPRTLAGLVAGVVGSIFSNARQVSSALAGFNSVRDQFAAYDPVPNTTPTRIQQGTNQNLVAQLFRGVALIEAARVVTQLSERVLITDNAQSPFDSRDEAESVRDDLLLEMDTEALSGSDDIYRAFVDLQRQWVAHITAHGQTLSRVAGVNVQRALPSLVLTHQLYGAIDLENDIVTRNQIRRPTALPARTNLEYLSLNG